MLAGVGWLALKRPQIVKYLNAATRLGMAILFAQTAPAVNRIGAAGRAFCGFFKISKDLKNIFDKSMS